MQSGNIMSLNSIRKNAVSFVENIKEKNIPILITEGNSTVAIVQDITHYKKLQDGICLLKILAQGEKEIQKENGSEQSIVFKRINKVLETKLGKAKKI